MDQQIRLRVAEDDLDLDEAEEMDQNLASGRNDQDRDDEVLGEVSACKGFEIEPGVFSGCDQSAGDCPVCGK